jgi:dTDP-4-dehydrorhamnose 3,5-epimerase
MNVLPTDLPGVLILEPQVHRDGRGFFLESYQAARYADAGITARFVQDNHSRSMHGTLRGLHAQRRWPQCKLIRVVHGEIFDVVVDIRVGSPTFGRWTGVTLSADNFRQCYVPPNFAHGFCVVSDWADVEYKCTDFYDASDEMRLLWNDPELAIRWPVQDPLLSEKDRAASPLAVLRPLLPVYDAESPSAIAEKDERNAR